ncbi:MAG: hypothetical protein AMXMBFR58_03050 [Phycisphaerae bacterium]
MHSNWPILISAVVAAACAGQPARITVIDSQTDRGVPLVELTTTNGIVHVTDSAGVIAFDEPGLMDSDVFFNVRSHGYQFPKDGFGIAGTRVRTTRGSAVTLRIDRVNIAERLYRATGAGIYRDSVLLGDTPPTREPLLNGGVLGQDSVQTALYRGKLFWFWGDTSRASYPLGNFSMSGAVSELPGRGGLDPAVGIDLVYFVGRDGFSRGMCPIEGEPGPVWADGLVTCTDASGRERLLCHWVRVKSLGEMYEQGFAVYNDEREVFEPVRRFAKDAILYMRSHPVRHADADGDYWYFPSPFPLIRCRAEYERLLDVTEYEAFTCLRAGKRMPPEGDPIPADLVERDSSGRVVYAWRRDTAPVLQQDQMRLIDAGAMKPDEALLQLRDAATGKGVIGHAGSVFWNEYLGSWLMVVQELFGATSVAGEIWLAKAPSLTGPWRDAVKIVTHDDYSFYNVKHHPYFDQEGGRVVYLEGTYTMAFSGTKVPTPRYDYNQVMYRVDLADARLGWAPGARRASPDAAEKPVDEHEQQDGADEAAAPLPRNQSGDACLEEPVHRDTPKNEPPASAAQCSPDRAVGEMRRRRGCVAPP